MDDKVYNENNFQMKKKQIGIAMRVGNNKRDQKLGTKNYVFQRHQNKETSFSIRFIFFEWKK